MLCCVICWEKQRKQPCVVIRTGDVGTCTWRCVEKKTCQSGHGPENRGSLVLDVAQRLGVCAVGKFRFERGTARYRTWHELERRALDWASRSLLRESLK